MSEEQAQQPPTVSASEAEALCESLELEGHFECREDEAEPTAIALALRAALAAAAAATPPQSAPGGSHGVLRCAVC